MNRKAFAVIGLALIILGSASLVGAAGSCTPTPAPAYGASTKIHKWEWTSDTDGNVSGEGAITRVSGMILMVRFVPGSGVSDLYDIEINDENGVDVLQGVGADLSNSASASTNLKTPFTAEGGFVYLFQATLTPKVQNAGNAKSGTIFLTVRQ
jgi:hypothetical protein